MNLWIIFIILLCFSAFFSGYESAILSLRTSRIRELVKKRVHNAKLVEKFKEDSHRTLITLLIGNNIVNISASALATTIALGLTTRFNLAEGYIIAIAVGVLTFLLLVFGEITPKTLGVRLAEKFALRGAKLFYFFLILFKPLVWIFESISSVILLAFGVPKQETIYTTGELKEFVEMSHEKGSIKESEKEMIHNILNFNDTLVREIMKPLSDVIAVEASTPIREFMDMFVKDNFSRIPVYEKHREDIIGVIYIKDVLPFIQRGELDAPIRKIMRKIAHVPAVKKINTLFRYFKQRKEHIAIVVNEFGNTLGIVTMEDVLEELVGEIQDESDDESENAIKIIDHSTLIVPGSTNIDEINEHLGTSIDDKDGLYQTIAGYISYSTGKIPKIGIVLTLGELTVTIIDASHKKINKVKVEKKLVGVHAYKEELVKSTEKLVGKK